MIDLGEEIYEILSENGWDIVGWGERIGQGWFYEIEYIAENGEEVIETVECVNDSREAFVEGVRNLCFYFDPEEHAVSWIDYLEEKGVPYSIQDLLDEANGIKDSLDDLRIALEDIDFEDEEMM